ncbi:hypothetical protein BJ138DRAFT_1176768 [Hygrophoropsis aurantiaca]|uniref:Uncharacterized protein n=1 Tax=Hygrophoropsis aurantiaca TaxID=72124 RepID=A0ACB8AP01_9AGAM|nr:hypothetical protein BJ138DRAFT_1176768 [Hygrophoropsis aurantiaca]
MASPKPTSLDDWTSKYSELALPDQWPTQLWDSAWRDQINVFSWEDVVRDNQPVPASELPVPSRICVMKGAAGELTSFQTKDIYVRDEYINITRRMVAFATYPGSDPVDSEVGGVKSSCVGNSERLPTNPFQQANMENLPFIMQVCSSPANGKSLFLHVLLRLRLNARLPTLLQFENEACYLFSDRGAHIIGPSTLARESSLAQDLGRLIPDAWCLVDSNVDMPIPSPFTRYAGLTIVQTESPREDRLKWAGKHTRSLKIFYMQPFNLTEAIVARSMQMTPHLPSERQLQLWYDRYTPSVRLAYQWAARIDEYESSLDQKLRQYSGSVLSLPAPLRGLGAFTFFTTTDADKLSLELFVVYPTANTADYVCDTPTRHLARKVIHAVNARTYAEHAKFREVLHVPGLSALGEHLMEELANKLLPQGRTPQQLHKLEFDEHAGDNDQQHWAVDRNSAYRPLWFVVGADPHPVTINTSPIRPRPSSTHALVPLEYDTRTLALQNGRFYVPRKPPDSTQAMLDLDSFIYQDGTAYLLQYAVARGRHAVRTGGLAFLRGLGVARVVYVGVVPAGQRPTFVVERAAAELCGGVIVDRYLLDFEGPG